MRNNIALGVVCVLGIACGDLAINDPAAIITGMYSLDTATGTGPAWGTLVLTRQGYAERRVRFREADGTLSREYLARGSVELLPDSTVALELMAIDPATNLPWTPDARLTTQGVQITYPDAIDGSPIVETYRRQ